MKLSGQNPTFITGSARNRCGNKPSRVFEQRPDTCMLQNRICVWQKTSKSPIWRVEFLRTDVIVVRTGCDTAAVNMGDLTDSRDPKKTFIVPAIKSFDHYDFNRAKIRASLTWLVAKAFGTGRWRVSLSPTSSSLSLDLISEVLHWTQLVSIINREKYVRVKISF